MINDDETTEAPAEAIETTSLTPEFGTTAVAAPEAAEEPEQAADPAPEPAAEDEPAPEGGVYYLIDRGVIVETLDANERWGRVLLDHQVVVHSSQYDG